MNEEIDIPVYGIPEDEFFEQFLEPKPEEEI
jgi:hypothetical protein